MSGCSQESLTGRPDEVVFSSLRDGRPEVYAVATSDGRIRRLTDAEGDDTSPAWSPNRKHVAFISDRGGFPAVWVMDHAGQAERAAFPDETQPVARFFWAPDSRRISYEALADGRPAIFVGDVTTGRSDALVREDYSVQLGGWSPDGVWVLYAVLDGPERGIYRRNPSGVDEVRLSSGPDTGARWSPRGGHIAFIRQADDGSSDVVVATRDGTDLKIVTTKMLNESDFDWSPDGQRIVFISDLEGNREVYSVMFDGRDARRLTTNRSAESAPRWSKSGGQIAFLSDTDGDFDLFVMRPDGSGQVKVADTDVAESAPDW